MYELIRSEWNNYYKETNDFDSLHDYCVDIFNYDLDEKTLKEIINDNNERSE